MKHTNMHVNDQLIAATCVEIDSRPTVLLLKRSPGHVDVRLLLEVNVAGPSVDCAGPFSDVGLGILAILTE